MINESEKNHRRFGTRAVEIFSLYALDPATCLVSQRQADQSCPRPAVPGFAPPLRKWFGSTSARENRRPADHCFGQTRLPQLKPRSKGLRIEAWLLLTTLLTRGTSSTVREGSC